MRESRLYLRDIVLAITSIESFVQGMDKESFKADDKTASAVVRKLEIIGEAAKGVPEDIRTQSPEIPWREMAGMRDKLIHFYFGIDYDLVWSTVIHRLPDVKCMVEELLADS